jgi:NAD+ dependent glucose-6-phosphate dehydrogenase
MGAAEMPQEEPLKHIEARLPASVLVTGAAGDLGQRTMGALVGLPLVRGLDRIGIENLIADLTQPAEFWQHHLDGVDVLVHLAGNGSPEASRPQAEVEIIGMTRALLRAATRARVRRIVFASTCHVLEGYRFGKHPLAAATPVFPVSPYGWAKSLCEEEGRLWAEANDSTFLALRIGMCLREGSRLPPAHRLSRWTLSKWLTDEDFAQAILRATTAEISGFHAMTIVSEIAGAPWDLSAARQLIGYLPTRLAPLRQTLPARLDDWRESLQTWAQGGPRHYV